MKKFSRMAGMAAVLLVAHAGFAQTAPAATNDPRSIQIPVIGPEDISLGARYMADEVGATAEQAQALIEIEADINERFRAAQKLELEQRTAIERDLMRERDRRDAAVLDKGQWAQVQQIKQRLAKEQTDAYRAKRDMAFPSE